MPDPSLAERSEKDAELALLTRATGNTQRLLSRCCVLHPRRPSPSRIVHCLGDPRDTSRPCRVSTSVVVSRIPGPGPPLTAAPPRVHCGATERTRPRGLHRRPSLDGRKSLCADRFTPRADFRSGFVRVDPRRSALTRVIGINMNLRQKILGAAAVAALLTTVGLGSGAMASPPTGTVTAGPATVGQLDGDNHDRLRASQDGIRLRTRVPSSVATFELTYGPNSESGWHSHQGIVVVVVKSGSVDGRPRARTRRPSASATLSPRWGPTTSATRAASPPSSRSLGSCRRTT